MTDDRTTPETPAGETLSNVRSQIETRVEELAPYVEEHARLEAALSALSEEATPTPRRRRTRRPTST